jgi:hypothetical protein
MIGVALAIVFAACGGDGEEPLTIEAYYAQLEVIINDHDDNEDTRREENWPLLMEMNEDLNAFLADETNLPILKEILADEEEPRNLGDALERLKGLNPPPEVEDAHNAFVEAGRASKVELEERYDVVHAAETNAELLDPSTNPIVSPGATQVVVRTPTAPTKACLDLVRVAWDHGLSPAIGCGRVF